MMAHGVRRTAAAACAGAVLSILLVAVAPTADGQDRSEYLIRLLRSSDSFRVRAQAALSLGQLSASEPVVRALSESLRDEHPSVRTAAAASLERLRDPAALPALRSQRRDSDTTVRAAVDRAIRALEQVARTSPRSTDGGQSPPPPTGPARYYVGVGNVGSKVQSVDRATLDRVRTLITQQIQGIEGVVIAPENEPARQATRVVTERRLTGYYIDSSIVSLEDNGDGTRAVISVIVNTYPGRDMRAMLRGAATVPGGHDAFAQRTAIEGAVRGAIRSLPQAMAASANR